MFKHVYHYWYNLTQKPSTMLVYNTWFYTSAKCFTLKLGDTLEYVETSLQGFKQKKLKIIPKFFFYDLFVKFYIFIFLSPITILCIYYALNF